MKIFSVFQAAPSIQSIYGFDLIINEDSIMFSMEKGVEILKYFQSLQTNNIKQNIQKSFDDLRKSLLLLHSFNITHNDIKPENMVFSPSKNKLVFIDFGLSQVNPQKLGQMKLQKLKGSFYYCCQDMKKLFKQNSGLGYVDMYYNDFYGLQKSQKNFENSYSNFSQIIYNKQIKKNNGIIFFNQSNNQQVQQIILINLIHLIYFQKLNQIQDLIASKQQVLINILNKYLCKIYTIFYQAIFNLSLFEAYKKLKNILFENRYHIQISLSSRQIFENHLNLFFRPIDSQDTKFQEDNQKILNKYVKQLLKKQNKKQKLKKLFFNEQTKLVQSQIRNIKLLNIKLSTLKSLQQSAQKVISF